MATWLPGILLLVLLLLLLGYACRTCVLQIRAVIVPQSSRSGQPECGGCGYIVRGLTKLSCPECGADLLEVGIIGSRGVEHHWRVLSSGVAGIAILAVPISFAALVLASSLQFSRPGWIAFSVFCVLVAGGSGGMLAARRRVRRGMRSSPPPAPPSPDR